MAALPAGAVMGRPRTAVPTHRGAYLTLSPPPDAPDPADLAGVRAWVRSQPAPTAVDLFCGAGGMSLGLQDAGFSVLVGADSSAFCIETHVANLRGLGYRGDLADPNELLEHLVAWGVHSVDLVAGGVPCQPFSRAGRSRIRGLVADGARSADDPRAHLWDSFIQVVEALRPRAVLLENVPDLAAWGDGSVLIGFREALHELGYSTDARILNAFDHGVPQHRMRLFIVGLRSGEEFVWPSPGTRHTLRDAIGDLPAVPGGQREDCIPYPSRPTTALQRRLREAVPDEHVSLVFDHITRAVRPDDAEAFSLLEPGGTYDDLPAHLRRYRSDIFTDKYKRLEWDELSRSITAHIAKDGYWYIHPDQDRTLSIREAARIQTFPDWFRCAGTPSHRYLQTGNAVPPLLAEAIGRQLVAALSSRRRRSTRREVDTFRDKLLRWHVEHARPFQWREGTADPWHVLMAELALPRMRSTEVPSVYRELIRAAPTPRRAVERRESIVRMIRSLGLGVRAANILRVADAIVEEHGGEVPATEAVLSLLPEVGDYVANAVLCFGFGHRAVLLDRSTERLIGRVRGRGNMHRWQLRLDLYDLAGRAGPDAAFNHALLDLGAHLCRQSHPLCDVCPVNRYCAGSMVGDRGATEPLAFSF